MRRKGHETPKPVAIPSGSLVLEGELIIPTDAAGIVLFAHGSGSSRHSPRNRFVASVIRDAGVGTLLFDLLTRQEESVDIHTGELRFNIGFLARRLADATEWLATETADCPLPVGYFGSSTGAAAALAAASRFGDSVRAVVSRGGRPDLAQEDLPRVTAPTLLIVGGLDDVVMKLNEQALKSLRCKKELRIVPGASHLFEEPGTLEEVARLAADWFRKHLELSESRKTG